MRATLGSEKLVELCDALGLDVMQVSGVRINVHVDGPVTADVDMFVSPQQLAAIFGPLDSEAAS